MADITCSIDGCERKRSSRGWCNTHYERWRRHGDPHFAGKFAARNCATPHDAFRAYMPGVPPEDSCWEWTGCRDSEQYGVISHDYRTLRAHRVAYELFVGKIPDGFVICHHCDNPSCCNPNHLYAGTNSENSADMVSRGRSRRGHREKKTRCVNGHILEGNQYSSNRTCKTCVRDRVRAFREKKRG